MSRPARDVLAVLAAVFTILATGAPANAAKKMVSALGTDSITCGTAASPCRSITQAITNAANGDTIVVGPGLYGDLDHDNVLGEPGEEPGGCGGNCLLEINKAVTVMSSDGPGATIIRGPQTGLNAAVSITAVNAALGKPGKGFTIFGGTSTPVDSSADGIKLMGNRLIGSAGYGAAVTGDNTVVRGNVAIGQDSSSTFCFLVLGDHPQILGNLATGCQFGFQVGATNWTMVGNVATNNASGMRILINPGNGEPPAKFLKNAFISNLGVGINVLVFNGAPATTMTLGSSNVFGNYCGIFVANNDADSLTINADQFFWGAASGPGSDPADAFCSFIGMATLNATNPKPKAYPIKGPVLR